MWRKNPAGDGARATRAATALGQRGQRRLAGDPQANGKAPYRPICTSPIADWYANRPLSGGTAKIGRRQLILAVNDRFRLSTVDFDRRRSIEGEIDRQRLIEEEKGKKKKRKRRKKKKRRISTSCRPRLRVTRGSPASCRRPWATFVPARGDETSPHAGREIEVTLDSESHYLDS
ncbi:hypothetical protein GW17_00012521 [Ensete ventricosum]|nr:hypothetical protein GW17_00012521 [Ensete ventricosum]